MSEISRASDLIDQYANPEDAIAVTRLVGQNRAYWEEDEVSRPEDPIVRLKALDNSIIVIVYLADEDFDWHADPKEIA